MQACPCYDPQASCGSVKQGGKEFLSKGVNHDRKCKVPQSSGNWALGQLPSPVKLNSTSLNEKKPDGLLDEDQSKYKRIG
jgi:hypothetical protein